MKITISPKKTAEAPARILVHGEPGIGKTTFAAAAPDVVFICSERGANNVAVSRVQVDGRDPRNFDEVSTLVDALVAAAREPNRQFQFVCLDTVDALEKMIHDHLCKTFNKKSVADFKYGSGYDNTNDIFRGILQRFESLTDSGVGIILLAHSKIEAFSNPEGQDFNYYEVKTHKKLAGQLVEWCDNVLFAKREQYALEENGKVRGVGGGARFLFTQKSPTYVAKNRFDLPEKMPLSWHEYEQHIRNFKPADPAEILNAIKEILKQFDEETAKEAHKSLKNIKANDARQLVQFLDYCRAKLEISQKPKLEKEEEKK